MKTGLSLSCLALVLLSCAYEGIAPTRTLPLREIHYDYETGEKVGEKTFVYNASGNLLRKSFVSLVNPSANYEVYNEYDGDGNLLKERRGNVDLFHVTEYTYANGTKLTETQSLEGLYPISRMEYYYSGSNTADSSRVFSYSTIDEEYRYSFSSVYSYDEKGRVKTQFVTYHRGGYTGRTEYTYDGKNLISTCDITPGSNGEEFANCMMNEYDRNGQLTKVLVTAGDFSQLQEEYFYKDGMLDEKKLYTYPGYDPTNTIDVIQVKYEY
jgi:hypothetical protein